jgi:hypothetical protein
MLRQAARVLISFVVALAVTMPVGAFGMPMAPNGMVADQPCQNCPQPDQTGNVNPNNMPACQVLACAGALAMLPTLALSHWHVQFRVVYPLAPPAHWADAAPAPNPFPPKPIVLL